MCNCLFCKDGKIYPFTGVLLEMVLWFIMQTERVTCLLVCCCRWYCGSDGLALPTDECDPGWYCTGGAESARPSDALQGGQCQAGNFCPRGSAVQLPCTPGYYCLDVVVLH